MPQFNIGDEVEIVEDKSYSITQRGSIGIITSILSNKKQVKVTFTHINFNDSYNGRIYTINVEDIKIRKPIDPKEAVLKKIKYLEDKALRIKNVPSII